MGFNSTVTVNRNAMTEGKFISGVKIFRDTGSRCPFSKCRVLLLQSSTDDTKALRHGNGDVQVGADDEVAWCQVDHRDVTLRKGLER